MNRLNKTESAIFIPFGVFLAFKGYNCPELIILIVYLLWHFLIIYGFLHKRDFRTLDTLAMIHGVHDQ